MASHWLSCWVSHWLGLLLGNKEVFPPPAGVGCGWAACLGDQDSFFLVVLSLVTQCVRLFATPRTVAHQAPLSVRFSWSGLPWPSPRHLPNSGKKPRSPALQADSLLSEAPGKPKNTGVSSLSLLQGIFPTQESNWVSCIAGMLYQLSSIGIFEGEW